MPSDHQDKGATPFFSVGLKALILNQEKKLLLIKRAGNNVIPDRWDVPGGRMSFGESLDEALRREVKEETGLEVAQIGAVVNVSTFFHVKDESNQIVRIIAAVAVDGTDVNLSGEHQEYEWIELENIHHYPLYSEVLKPAVQELARLQNPFEASVFTPGFLR